MLPVLISVLILLASANQVSGGTGTSRRSRSPPIVPGRREEFVRLLQSVNDPNAEPISGEQASQNIQQAINLMESADYAMAPIIHPELERLSMFHFIIDSIDCSMGALERRVNTERNSSTSPNIRAFIMYHNGRIMEKCATELRFRMMYTYNKLIGDIRNLIEAVEFVRLEGEIMGGYKPLLEANAAKGLIEYLQSKGYPAKATASTASETNNQMVEQWINETLSPSCSILVLDKEPCEMFRLIWLYNANLINEFDYKSLYLEFAYELCDFLNENRSHLMIE